MTEAPQVEGERSTQSEIHSVENLKISWNDIDSAISILKEILQEREAREKDP